MQFFPNISEVCMDMCARISALGSPPLPMHISQAVAEKVVLELNVVLVLSKYC